MEIIYSFFYKHYLYYIYTLINSCYNTKVYTYFKHIKNSIKTYYFIDTDKLITFLQSLNTSTIYMVHDIVCDSILNIKFNNQPKVITFLKYILDKFIKNFNLDSKVIQAAKIFDKTILIFDSYFSFFNLFKNFAEFINFLSIFNSFNIVIFIKNLNYSYKKSLELFIHKNKLEYKVSLENSIILIKEKNKNIIKNIKIRKFLNFYNTNNINFPLDINYITSVLPYIKNINKQNKKKELKKIKNYLSFYLKNNSDLIDPVLKSINKTFYTVSSVKPLSSFLFCGPSGSGKTELVKILSYALFKSFKYLIKLNMSEYMEPHSISKLIGSPPGYAGYENINEFANKVSSLSKSIILFDEIEKAHKSINDLMLQILEEGKLTLSNGEILKFNNSFIIFTSNLGCDNSLTFSDKNSYKYKILKDIKMFFRPEFISRLNNILIFNPVTYNMCFDILNTIINKININNVFTFYSLGYKIKEEFIKYSYNILYGLRPLYKLNDLLSTKIKTHNNRFSSIKTTSNTLNLLKNLISINFKHVYSSHSCINKNLYFNIKYNSTY
ncbi:ATPases with chaperone activity (apicoplast) [Babesia ovis]|uniref:ATPases with chaperone activity n=1 Tax=Babesia ovis TaxID=5869 RepID=A0A9W5TCV2_BABOV|nr:ATPases with chaperone activity [Babesia ovis]